MSKGLKDVVLLTLRCFYSVLQDYAIKNIFKNQDSS